VTFISNTINNQATYNTAISDINTSFQTDNDQIVDDLQADIEALMTSMTTAITVTAKTGWDSYITA
jgi:hypothetical protein